MKALDFKRLALFIYTAHFVLIDKIVQYEHLCKCERNKENKKWKKRCLS